MSASKAPKPSPKYVLKECTTYEEFKPVFDTLWESLHADYDSHVAIFFPFFGHTQADRDASFQAGRERFWKDHENFPGESHWIYVLDETTNVVASLGKWMAFPADTSSSAPHKIVAEWWPEGEGRDVASMILNQAFWAQSHWMRHAHVSLSWMATHSQHQRRGAGSMVVAWGNAFADRLGMDSLLEASLMGFPLYQHFNYRTVLKMDFHVPTEGKSDMWKRYAHDLTPKGLHIMYRPKRGEWVEGMTLPWGDKVITPQF